MSFRALLNRIKPPTLDDIDNRAMKLEKDISRAFSPLESDEYFAVYPDDPIHDNPSIISTRVDFASHIAGHVLSTLQSHILENGALDYEDVEKFIFQRKYETEVQSHLLGKEIAAAISDYFTSHEFTESVAQEIAKNQLYRDNEELAELEKLVVMKAGNSRYDHKDFTDEIDLLVRDLPLTKQEFVYDIAEDYGYVGWNKKFLKAINQELSLYRDEDI